MVAAGRLRNGNPSRCDRTTRNNNKQIYRILFQYDNATFLAYNRYIQTLLPTCPNAHITKLYNLRYKVRQRFTTSIAELTSLRCHFNTDLCGSVEDSTCGSRIIETVLKQDFRMIEKVANFDIDPAVFPDVVLDALNPWELKTIERPDYIIFSPPWEETDAFLFYAAKRCKKAVVALVAGDFLTNPPSFRARAWNAYAKNKKTHVIVGLPLVPGRPTRRAMWVVIAKTTRALKTLLAPSLRPCHMCLEEQIMV